MWTQKRQTKNQSSEEKIKKTSPKQHTQQTKTIKQRTIWCITIKHYPITISNTKNAKISHKIQYQSYYVATKYPINVIQHNTTQNKHKRNTAKNTYIPKEKLQQAKMNYFVLQAHFKHKGKRVVVVLSLTVTNRNKPTNEHKKVFYLLQNLELTLLHLKISTKRKYLLYSITVSPICKNPQKINTVEALVILYYLFLFLLLNYVTYTVLIVQIVVCVNK